jgi:hypothetical protein
MRAQINELTTVCTLQRILHFGHFVFLLFLLAACATSPDPATHFTPTSNIAQALNTFAIYNDEARLLSNPLLDLQRATSTPMTNAKCAGSNITDVYVFTHGWNFTLQKAIANSHGYLELMDLHLPTSIHGKPFCPFSIFVVWPSVSRPLGDIATAVLPFGLDRGIRRLTTPVDGTIFFLPSAWKESLQSFTMALGRKQPNIYFNNDWNDWDYDRDDPRRASCEPLDGEDLYGVDEEMGRMGRDCPVSALLFNLLKWNKRVHSNKLKIHIVGHSYGAKLVTLATIEALRRWGKDTAPANAQMSDVSYNKASTPHKGLCDTQPIESLVIFNPAFNPREIVYHSDSYLWPLENRVFPTEYLQCIPRKALVYGRRDHATGGIFNLSQILMDNRINTYIHQVVNWGSESKWLGNEILQQVYGLTYGPALLLEALLLGPTTWTVSTLMQLPGDAIWHIHTNDSIIHKDPQDGLGWTFGRGFVNMLDFVLPFSHLNSFASNFPDDADKLGLFRSTMPALGNTGLDKLYAGRTWATQLSGDDWLNLIDQDQHSTDQNQDSFCRIAAKADPNSMEPLIPNSSLKADWLYSFNGHYVMNTFWSFSGAHADLRKKDKVVLPAQCGNPSPIQKREAIFNFVLNFTKR